MKLSALRCLSFLGLLLGSGALAQAQLTLTADFTGADTTGFFGGAGSSSVSGLSDAATAEATIQTALNNIAAEITTTTPVNLTISFVSDPNTGLGASTPYTAYTYISYATYEADLAALPKSANDVAAQASLLLNAYSPSQQVYVTAADLMALGDTSDGEALIAGSNGLAGTVALNFNLLSTSRANETPGKYDLISVATHEVDELLGIGGSGSTLGRSGTAIGVLDPFRYSAPGVRSYSTSADTTSYLSLDGGVTKIAYFNQYAGGDYGDYGNGVNPAEAQSSANGGTVQDAFTGSNAEHNLGPAELSALDAIGYTLTPLGAEIDGLEVVPEPSTWAMTFGGLGLLAFCVRRKRASSK